MHPSDFHGLFASFDLEARGADRLFLEQPGGPRLTYGDLLAGSARYANALAALGLEPGDRVAVQVEKSAEAILLYLGVLRAGGVYLPLNTGYTTAEMEYFLGDASPAIVVCDPRAEPALRQLGETIGCRAVEVLDAAGRGGLAERAGRCPSTFTTVVRGPEDPAAILYTSGTTGRSKGAVLTQWNLASNAQVLAQFWRFTADDVLLHALPIFHIHGLFVALNTVLTAGASILFLPKFDAAQIVEHLPRATVMMGVPTFYVRLLEEPRLDAELVRGVRLFVSGSAPLLAETHREWRSRTGHAILERYGMTETGMNTSNPYDGERKPGTVGPPLPGVELRVTAPDTGAPLAQGEIGMIEVRGPNVFQGYWRMPEKTAAEFRPDGFFITGDLGLIDDDGYVQIVGRGKDLIITGGYNVYPKEVEGELDALPGVLESAVIGLPHKDFGEAVTAVVVLRPGAVLSEDTALADLSTRLASFKRPKRVLFVESLPRNAMGKVQKAALRESYASLYQGPRP